MTKFKQCPRCDKRYWFIARYDCKRCGFFVNGAYQFETDKWHVYVNENVKQTSLISKVEFRDKTYTYGSHFTIPYHQVVLSMTIPLRISLDYCISPKATDDDIDKLLVLM